MTTRSSIRLPGILLLLLMFAVLLLPTGCGEDGPATRREPSKPPWLWSSLGFWQDFILGVTLEENVLYVAAGRMGVHRQDPAFFGEWESLGLEFPDMPAEFPLYGVNEVVVTGRGIHALVRHPGGDGTAAVWRLEPGSEEWRPADAGLGDETIVNLLSTGDGHLLAVSGAGRMFRSTDDGEGWEEVFKAIPPGSLAQHQGPGGVFVGGTDPFLQPYLLRSLDFGKLWEPLPLEGRFDGVSDARVVSIGTSRGGESTLVVVLDDRVYVSRDEGASYRHVLQLGRTSGYVLVNPDDSGEILVASDMLYHSRDGGESWVGYPPPKGGELGKAAADWDRRYVAIWDWQPWPQPLTLYCVNLDAPDKGEVVEVPSPR